MSSFGTPHFDLPFRFATTAGVQSAATVEQDTIDDIVNCVIGSLNTHIGWRPERPAFGTSEMVFMNQPLDLDTIIQQVTKDEPRVALFLEQYPDQADVLVARVRVHVSTRGVT